MIKISFILPCYNVESYISDCLNSIYSQELPEEEFEVICVNDCSTDGTRRIINQFSEKYTNLRLIDHKKNLTAGGARNSGIGVAKGQYIWFVDPDDEIKANSVTELYTFATERDLDVLMFNYETLAEDRITRKIDVTFPNSETLSGQDYALKYFPGRFSVFCIVWRCLFRTNFIRKNSLDYPEIRKSQDVVFLWKVMIHAEKVSSINNVCYVYKTNPFSVTHMMRNARVAFSNVVLWPYQVYLILQKYRHSISNSIVPDMVKEITSVNSSLFVVTNLESLEIPKFYDEIQLHKLEVKTIRRYMNKRNKVLYDTSLGKKYWILKCNILSHIMRKHISA